MKFRSIIFLFLFSGFTASGQGNHSVGGRVHYGFIIPHTASIEPISHTKPYGFEVSLSRLHTNYESWDVFRRYNISGIQAGYFNYQNPEVVGSSYTLTIYTEPIFFHNDKFYFSVRAGGGISWQTRIWHYEYNQANRFFSTRISMPLLLSARFNYRVAEKTYLTLAGTYNHISNGAMRVPNMGINFPTMSLGFEYYPSSFPQLDHNYVHTRTGRSDVRYLLFQVIGGFKYVWDEPTVAVGGSIRYVWQLRDFYSLNAGVEFIADGGVKKYLEIHEIYKDYKRFAVTGGQDFILGKLYFTQYLGFYLYAPYKARNLIYQKYELSMKITPGFRPGVYLKAHTSDADLFGLSLNYILGIKP
ncbi:MAG TPA: acyloxyacyl hydrolase [Bacteroidales bacterium]|nr:acyloxyacyl hydrolase [Bacteroidales bacterium]